VADFGLTTKPHIASQKESLMANFFGRLKLARKETMDRKTLRRTTERNMDRIRKEKIHEEDCSLMKERLIELYSDVL